MARLIPYVVLLVGALLFFRPVLFTGSYDLPWDLPGYHLPLASYLASSLREGRFPLWDPYTYCGTPFYANLPTQSFYPPGLALASLANLLGPRKLQDLLEWQVALHVFAAGVFTYWLLRRMGAARGPATFGATVFELGGYFASQAQHLGAVCAAAWMPLAWLGVIELARGFAWRRSALLATPLCLAFLAGFPAVTIVVWVSCGILALCLVALRRASWRLLPAVAVCGAWAAMLSAVQLLPALELVNLSEAPRRGEWAGTGGGLPLEALWSLIVPNYHGIFQLETYSASWNPTFLYLYCGLAGIGFAAAGAVMVRSARAVAITTLLSALWMLGASTPVGLAFYRVLPVRLRSPLYAEFAMSAFVLGVAVLAALAAERLLGRKAAWSWALVAVLAADLLYQGSGRPMNAAPAATAARSSQDEFEGSTLTVASLRKLQNSATPPWRYDVLDDSVYWMTVPPMLRAPSAAGNEPLAPARVLRLRRLFAGGVPWQRNHPVSAPDAPLLSLLNVRYLVAWETSTRLALGDPRWRLAAGVHGHAWYENREVLPRFFLVGRTERAAHAEKALERLQRHGFDFTRTAVVEAPGTDSASADQPLPPVRVLDHRPEEVLLETDAPAPAFLVTSETWYPGWRAYIDGREQPLIPTNAAFRGLAVPAGRHRILMRFQPRILRIGAGLSAAAGLLLLLAIRPWAFRVGLRRR